MLEQSFSASVLHDLRRDCYRPRAWRALLSASWRQARVTAAQHPTLVCDWRWLTGELGVAMLSLTAYTARRHGWRVAARSTTPLLLMMLLQAGDSYVHLGLHRRDERTTHLRLGPAMSLTALRCWVGAAIISRLASGALLTDAESLVALSLILATDIADGRIARHQALMSALGGYLDGEADLVAWTALTLTQWRRGQLPTWFVGAFALRWGLPLTLMLGQIIAKAMPVTLTPSRFARAVGAAQVVTAATVNVAAMRANTADARRWARAQRILVKTTGILLMATAVRRSVSLLPARIRSACLCCIIV